MPLYLAAMISIFCFPSPILSGRYSSSSSQRLVNQNALTRGYTARLGLQNDCQSSRFNASSNYTPITDSTSAV